MVLKRNGLAEARRPHRNPMCCGRPLGDKSMRWSAERTAPLPALLAAPLNGRDPCGTAGRSAPGPAQESIKKYAPDAKMEDSHGVGKARGFTHEHAGR